MADPKEIRAYVDEYARLSVEYSKIKEQLDWIKGYFETLAEEDLKDTKLLTATYWGEHFNSRVTVTNAATVKPVSITMVKEVLGNVAGDFIKTETTDTMTAPCKRLLAMVAQGNYTEGSLDNLIRRISEDPKIQATLQKKLKTACAKGWGPSTWNFSGGPTSPTISAAPPRTSTGSWIISGSRA